MVETAQSRKADASKVCALAFLLTCEDHTFANLVVKPGGVVHLSHLFHFSDFFTPSYLNLMNRHIVPAAEYGYRAYLPTRTISIHGRPAFGPFVV